MLHTYIASMKSDKEILCTLHVVVYLHKVSDCNEMVINVAVYSCKINTNK